MKRLKYFFAFMMVLLIYRSIIAQDNITDKNLFFQKYSSQTDSNEKSTTDFQSSITDSVHNALSAEEIQAHIEYYRHIVSEYHHTQKVFEWQLIASRIIFGVVIILVLSGIVLSWLQFTKSKPIVTDAAGNPVNSELKLSFKSGIEVSSPVLGVLVLIISLAFFYIYLVNVYQIRIVH